jgi:hypothetical protein
MIHFLFIKGVIEVGYNVHTFLNIVHPKEQKELQTQGLSQEHCEQKEDKIERLSSGDKTLIGLDIKSEIVETKACNLDYVLAYTHFLNVSYDDKLNPILGCADTHKLTQPFSVYEEFEPLNKMDNFSTLSSSEHIMINKNRNKYLHQLKNGYI